MGRLEFPAKPINAPAHDAVAQIDQTGEMPRFVQPALEGWETEQPPEIEFGNCLVTSPVTFRKRVKGNLWQCHIQVEPDLLHQDQEGEYEAVAQQADADMANSNHLRPGDRALMRGVVLPPTTITLANGEITTINRFAVTGIEVLAHSRRTSITVYEQAQTK